MDPRMAPPWRSRRARHPGFTAVPAGAGAPSGATPGDGPAPARLPGWRWHVIALAAPAPGAIMHRRPPRRAVHPSSRMVGAPGAGSRQARRRGDAGAGAAKPVQAPPMQACHAGRRCNDEGGVRPVMPGLAPPRMMWFGGGPRAVARAFYPLKRVAACTKSSKTRRVWGSVSSKTSGCHCTPMQKWSPGSSTASISPSGATADAASDGASSFSP